MNEKENFRDELKIYLAPLQGFTDFIYRQCYAQIFPGIDTFFIPYVSVKNDTILKKYSKEILPENNPMNRAIPQVLVKNAEEIIYLSKLLQEFGYKEINLNLGCPYPMVTNRGKGAGLLQHPNELEKILNAFFERTNLQLSIKMRAGLLSPYEIESIIPVLNKFPLSEIIFHPRVAKQLYTGEIYLDAFRFVETNIKHQLVYNGDVFTLDDFKRCKTEFPQINHWMLGRGTLMNPFLPAEIKNITFSTSEKVEKLKEFHQLIYQNYIEIMDNKGNVLNKMKQFWIYFSSNFSTPRKCLKHIKKSRNLKDYQSIVNSIFRDAG